MKNEKVCSFVGWHHASNTGDDAMLLSIIDTLAPELQGWTLQFFTKRYPFDHNKANSKLRVSRTLAGTLMHRFRRYYIRSWDPDSRIWSMGYSSNIAVYGGGNIFHSATSIDWKKAVIDALGKKGGRSYFAAVGVGFGPFKNQAAENEAKDFVRSLDLVIVRDRSSYIFVQRHAKREAVVLISPDIAFQSVSRNLLPAPARDLVGQLHRDSQSLLIAPHGPQTRALGAKERRALRRELVDYATANFASVGLLVSCANKASGDTKEVRKMVTLFKGAGIEATVIPYDPNPLKIQESMNGFDFVLSQRLHPLVYASALGQGIAEYGQTGKKALDVLRQIGLERIELSASCGGIYAYQWPNADGPNKAERECRDALNTLAMEIRNFISA